MQNVTSLPHLLDRLGGFGNGTSPLTSAAAAGAIAELSSKEAAARRYRTSHFSYIGVLIQIGRFMRAGSTTTTTTINAVSGATSSDKTGGRDHSTENSGSKSISRNHGSDLRCIPLPLDALCDPGHPACAIK